MYSLIKANPYRAGSLLASIALIGISCIFRDTILIEGNFNRYGYWTGIVTIIALVAAIGEILQTLNTARTIKSAISKQLIAASTIASSSLLSEAISLLDESSDKVAVEDFRIALRLVQISRRLYARVEKRYFVNHESAQRISNSFNTAEERLAPALHATATSPLPKTRRVAISEAIRQIKIEIESIESKMEPTNAASQS